MTWTDSRVLKTVIDSEKLLFYSHVLGQNLQVSIQQFIVTINHKSYIFDIAFAEKFLEEISMI